MHPRGLDDNGADSLSNFLSMHSRPASHNGAETRHGDHHGLESPPAVVRVQTDPPPAGVRHRSGTPMSVGNAAAGRQSSLAERGAVALSLQGASPVSSVQSHHMEGPGTPNCPLPRPSQGGVPPRGPWSRAASPGEQLRPGYAEENRHHRSGTPRENAGGRQRGSERVSPSRSTRPGLPPSPSQHSPPSLPKQLPGPASMRSAWQPHTDNRTVSFVSMALEPNSDFRPYMEDGQKVVDPLLVSGRHRDESWGFFAVYDGHGGRKEVEYCEAKLHDIVLTELRNLPPGREAGLALRSAFEKVDSQLAMTGAWDSGCTATVALAHRCGNSLTLHVANVGDSRAVVIGDRGARRVSRDHRASDPAEAKRVQDEGGTIRHARVAGQLSISRSLGDHRLKSMGVSCLPDIHSFDAMADCALVIASDGLWDALEDEETAGLLQSCVDQAVEKEGPNPKAVTDLLKQDAAKAFVERAKERGSRDNILALVVFF